MIMFHRSSGTFMRGYRAYLLDKTGHVVKAVELACPDDAAAVNSAQQLVDGHDVEVWELARKVALLKHKPEDG
jgi:hypothetical protein